MKLHTKLPIFLIPLLCLPLILLGTIAYIELKKSSEQNSIDQLDKLFEQITFQSNSLIKTAQANAELIASDPLVESYLLAKEERYTLMQRPLLRKIQQVMSVFPQYYEVRILLPDGYEDLRLTNHFIPNLREDEFSTPLFTNMMESQSPSYTQLLLNSDNNMFSLYVSQRLNIKNSLTSKPEDKVVGGYLVITVDLTELKKSLAQVPWEGGHLVLTDRRGQVVLAAGDEPVTERIKSHITNAPWSSDHQHFELHDMDDTNRFYHGRVKIQDNLWLHGLIPEATLLQSSRNISSLVANITMLSIILSIPLLLALNHYQISRPLQQFHKAFSRLGSGKELVQIDTQGDDELNELGREFNRMSKSLHRSHEKIRELAFSDSLTGLPNRFMFTKQLHSSIKKAETASENLTVMFLDLDNFKMINDSLGHHAGDSLLQQVAERLSDNLRCNDTISSNMVARLGGDEFTVLLKGLETPEVVERVAQRIIDIIALPIELEGSDYYLSASVGVASYPENGRTTQELIKNADIAMYQAKKVGKGNFQNYTDTLSQQNEQMAFVEQRLHKAIEEQAFDLYYQPIIDSDTQKVVSLEALIRWSDPEKGFISPDVFIPIAERNGMITTIGDWVISTAIKQLQIWQKMGYHDIQVAVNVSAVQLGVPNFAQKLSDAIHKARLIPGSLYIELTETAVLSGEKNVLTALNELRDRNIKIALDDFGTGYSSLSYLRDLPIDILKIDRSFTTELSNRNNNIILSAIIMMAHALGHKIVAEGVEDESHRDFLIQEGCDLLQGYLFSRPRPAREISELFNIEYDTQSS